DADLAAKRCLSKGQRRCRENIHILALEDRMSCHLYFHQKISSRTSIPSRFSFFPDTDALSVVNSGRNRYLNLLSHCGITRSAAIRTLIPDHFTAAAALRTCLNVPDHTEYRLLS